VINSSITEASKTKAWFSINSWESKIILWTRTSLFYPYSNLWLIIIDVEHDNSYQSDQAPRYNSIEIANKITDLYWNKLLLASWTPSINSMYKAVKWKYKLLKLLEKY
jgi:primosomal protein N' (replication factor Y)